MHFFQFAATWLFPCAVCATMATTTTTAAVNGASTVEHDRSSSPAFRAGVVKAGADPGSSPSASSTSSSTSSLLGTRWGSPNSARSPEKPGGAASTPRGDAVKRCLRRIAKKLQRAARADDEHPDGRRQKRRKNRSKTMPNGRPPAVVDGTAREREQAVASAIAYCKETMSRPRGTSPTPTSPNLNGRLLDRPEEDIGSACAAARCNCPALRRDASLLEWLPEVHAAVPHQRGCAASDECGGTSAVAETGKGAARRGLAGELAMGDIFDGVDIDLPSYFAAKYELCSVEQLLN
ncbi:unnamed protein product [Alopecurus aequalis]